MALSYSYTVTMKNIYVLDLFETQVTSFNTYKEALSACLPGCDDVRKTKRIIS